MRDVGGRDGRGGGVGGVWGDDPGRTGLSEEHRQGAKPMARYIGLVPGSGTPKRPHDVSRLSRPPSRP